MWAHRKADLSQQKEAWYHKWNNDKCSRAVSFRMGDMVLLCVTVFKGRHIIQSRWKNREYVVEQQPYLTLPVYMVHPIDGEGCSHTLHRNYWLPISNNLEEQEECKNAVEEGGSNEPTPVPHEEDAMPVNFMTESQLEGIPNSPSRQHKLVIPGLTGLTSPDTMDEGPQANDDTPVPLRWNFRTMRNLPPWRYPGAFNMWVGLCICLHIMSCLYNIFVGIQCKDTLFSHHRFARHKQFLALMGIPLMLTLWCIFRWGRGPKNIWSEHCYPTAP